MEELVIIENRMKKLLGVDELIYAKSKGGFLLSNGDFADTTKTSHSEVAEYFGYYLDSLLTLGIMRVRIDGDLLSLEYFDATNEQKKILHLFLQRNGDKIKRVCFERSFGALDYPQQAAKIFEILKPKFKPKNGLISGRVEG